MAIAERILAAEFNRPAFGIVDHHTYVSVGDGCLMEGISHEACSLAGALALGKLIALYDDNKISIDGEVKDWFRDDTPKRFEAYGWHVVANVDGHDVESVDRAIRAAKAVADKPSLICCKTVIGKGAPTRAGTAKAHGEALGAEEVAATRAAIGWRYPPFEIPGKFTTAGTRKSAARSSSEPGTTSSRRTKKRTRSLHASSAVASRASCRRTGAPTAWGCSNNSSPRRNPSPLARPRRTQSKASRPCCPSWSVARPI